ncbi:Penicillin-binding protein 2 (PBP-2) [Clostridiaceae bacterium JG1575]|nr:Penicillin-binding protein 2 (PBP-2) [Clostridiaceae bacterium JG1575]
MNSENQKPKRRIFNRYTALGLCLVLVMGLITKTLFDMQIVKGEEYQNKADAYSVRDMSDPAPRGEILDRNGAVLATNLMSYDVIYNETRESSLEFYSTMKEFLRLLDQTKEPLHDVFEIKAEPDFAFDFHTTNRDAMRFRELRFKKDRNMDEWILAQGYGKTIGKSQIKDLSDAQSKELDAMLMAVSAKETFEYLVRYHGLYRMLRLPKEQQEELLKKNDAQLTQAILNTVPLKELRRYLLVRDQVRMKVYQSNKAVTLAKNLNKKSAFVFMQRSNLLSGIDVQLNPTRIYPYGPLGSHALGYLSTISEGSRERYESRGYDVNQDMVGVYGIEEAFEQELRGTKGVSTVKVDLQGRTVNELFKLEGYPGSSVQLTLDKDLQYTAEQALSATLENLRTNFVNHRQGKSHNATRGAVVVLDVKTGKVLAMASNPSFDPNVFITPGALTQDLYRRYFDPDLEAFGKDLIARLGIANKTVDDLFPKNKKGIRQDFYDNYPKPFFNYATQGLSAVGSSYKPFTALAALEAGVLDPNTIIDDKGIFQKPELPNYSATNNNKVVMGPLNFNRALTRSSNVFFLETAWRLYNKEGLDSLAHTAWKFGLGHDPKEGIHSTTGIEINENIFGNVFNYESRKRLIGIGAYADMAALLRSGVGRDGKKFQPLEISLQDSDSEKVKALKLEMDERLRKFWTEMPAKDSRTLDEKFNAIRDIVDYSLDAIMDTYPKEARKNLPDSSYLADQVAAMLLYDRGGELNSPVNILNAALGQGDTELSLLQMANAAATLANGGIRYRTSLVDRIINPEGQVAKVIEPEILGKVDLKPEHLAQVKEAMINVNNNDEGTGFSYMEGFPIQTAGKTGTAQYQMTSTDSDNVGRHQYGTYITYAPANDPQIAIAVIGYDVVYGSYMIPVARAIYEKYFEKEIARDFPDYRPSFDFQLKPVLNVEPSLLKLKNPTKELTAPVMPNYVPGRPIPPSMRQPINTVPSGAPGPTSKKDPDAPKEPPVEAHD